MGSIERAPAYAHRSARSTQGVWRVGPQSQDGRFGQCAGFPSAASDFYIEPVLSLVELEGEPEIKPTRHGRPVTTH